MPAQGPSRRDFIRLAGVAGGVGLLGLGMAACAGGTASTTPSPTSTAGELKFRSRPDIVVPEVKVLKRAPGDLSGHFFLNTHTPNLPNGPLILDGQGHTQWFLPVDGKFVVNLSLQEYAGKQVLTWWEGQIVSVGYGQGIHVIADDSYQQIATVQAAHGWQADLHDFQLTPQGTALITVYREIEADLSSLGGPEKGKALEGIVQEIEIATGNLLFEWRSSDHIEIGETQVRYSKSAEPFDYLHLNSIDVDTDGNLLISARNTWALYKIDRKSGDIIWRLGGKQGNFEMGADTGFGWQHDARRQADGSITLFDDAVGPPKEGPRSRGMVLDVDESAMRVSLKRQFTDGNMQSTSQGNVQVLPDGSVLVGWGAVPQFTQFSATGDIVFDARFQTANQSYRAYRFAWTGHPVEPPRAVAVRGTGHQLTVYASWNGATELTSWRVMAGADAQHLTMVGGAPRTGFETAIKVTTEQPHVVAQALDAAGNVLGTTGPIAAG